MPQMKDNTKEQSITVMTNPLVEVVLFINTATKTGTNILNLLRMLAHTTFSLLT